MLSKITEDQLQRAITAFTAELPHGTVVQAIRLTPRNGLGDDGAGAVAALVLADSEEDFSRFQQLIKRGMAV